MVLRFLFKLIRFSVAGGSITTVSSEAHDRPRDVSCLLFLRARSGIVSLEIGQFRVFSVE